MSTIPTEQSGLYTAALKAAFAKLHPRDLAGNAVIFVTAALTSVLSVRDDEAGKIAALDAGAQDFVTKPFSTGELLARLRGLLRDRAGDAPSSVVQLGPLVIDAADHRATMAGQDLRLTRKEFDLLWLLASHAGRLVTQEMILKAVWGAAHVEDSQYLRVYIRQLRAKLHDDAADPRWIFTEPGVGYRLADR